MKKISSPYLVSILAILLSFTGGFNRLSGQSPGFYSIQDGISNSTINNFLQSKQGYLWISTENGLNRFDGFQFKVYSPALGNNMLERNVRILFEDSDDNIWLQYQTRGIARLHLRTETFHNYLHEVKTSKNEKLVIHDVIHDKKRNLTWVASNNGLFVFDKVSEEFKPCTSPTTSPPTSSIQLISVDTAGNIWCGTNAGLSIYNPGKKQYFNFTTDPNDWTTVSMNTMLSIEQDYSGSMWIGTMWGINLAIVTDTSVYPAGLKFKRIIPQPGNNYNNFINTITPHPNGDILITTNRALLLGRGLKTSNPVFHEHFSFDPGYQNPLVFLLQPLLDSKNNIHVLFNYKTKSLFRYNYQKNEFIQLPINFSQYMKEESGLGITSAYIDDSDVLWIGIEKSGVVKHNLGKKEFDVDLEGKDVYGIVKNKEGSLFVGSRLGLYVLKHGNSSWKLVSPDNNPTMPYKFVGSLRSFDENELWIGYWDGLMSRYDTKKNHFINYPYQHDDTSTLSNWSVREILKDSRGNTWIGGAEKGLTRMMPGGSGFVNYNTHPDPRKKYGEKWLIKIHEDKEGILWLGGREKGLYRFDPEKEEFENFGLYSQGGALLTTEIKDIIEHPAGVLWLASGGAGLIRFTVADQQFRQYTTDDGLSSNTIQSLQLDNQGNIWIGTYHGLSRFDPGNNQFRNFYTSDGLPGNEFNEGASYQDNEGKLYFGSSRGLVSFFPGLIHAGISNYVPKIALTGLFLSSGEVQIDSFYHNRKLLTRSINYTDQLVLTRKHKMIRIEFAAFHFTDPGKIKYFYKLENFDKEWRETGNTSRRATYTNLPPGKYTFHVRSTNADGIETPGIKSIDIHVLTPWYQSIWFKITISLLLSLLTLSLYLWRVRQLRLKQIRLKQLVEERTRELKIANELLVQQKIQLEQQSEQLKEADFIKTRFFINISHELKTPLTLILSPVESLLARIKQPDQLKSLNLVYKNATRLFELINQLLDIRKIETGNKKILLVKDDIVEFLSGICQLFQESAREKNINLVFDPGAENHSRVLFDTDVVNKIVHNLLSNAVKYTPSGESITVTTRIPDQEILEITVTNTGIGIPESKHNEVFVRFYQHDPNQENMGYGIGLSYVKDLVDLYHGEISVSSKDNEYTSFAVSLPIVPERIPGAQLSSGTRVDTYKPAVDTTIDHEEDSRVMEELDQASLPILLIIEDSEDLSSYLKAELSGSFVLHHAGDGRTGLELAFELVPDIIISDIMMPGMDGISLCKEVKSDIRTSHVPVILLTARSTADDQVTGLNTGADDYITKPFNLDILKAKVESLLKNRKILANKILSPRGTHKSTMGELDIQFIEQCKNHVKKNIFNPKYSYDEFFDDLNMSKSNCYRKIKALTGKSPGEYILIEKMKLAAEYLQSGKYKISQLAYEMGYNNPSNFTRDFKKVFQRTPREMS